MSGLQIESLAISICFMKVSVSDTIAIYFGDDGTILSIIRLMFSVSKIYVQKRLVASNSFSLKFKAVIDKPVGKGL